MKKTLTVLSTTLALAFMACGTALAFPTYQLYIDPNSGGTFDSATQTWVTSASPFTLSALYEPGKGSMTNARLTVALPQGVNPAAGSIAINQQGGSTLANSGWVLGVPPISSAPLANGTKALSEHGIYPTWYTEYLFDFSNAAPIFDAQPGAQPGTKNGYREDFNISISGFSLGHFDLYNLVSDPTSKKYGGIAEFAPFSHDAGFTPPIPEPRTMVLLGISLITAAGYMKRIYRKKS